MATCSVFTVSVHKEQSILVVKERNQCKIDLNKLVELSTKEGFLVLQTRGYDIKQWFLNWNDFCLPRDNSQCLKMILVVTTWVVGAMGYGDLLPAPTRYRPRILLNIL